MKLRIVAGGILAERYQGEAGLQVLVHFPGLVIQGDETVEVISRGEQPTAILAGRIFGWQNAAGDMHRLEDVHTDLEPLLRQQSIEWCLDALEGPYILVLLKLDGSCDISCDRFGQVDLYYQQVDDGIVFATDLSLLPVSSRAGDYDQVALAHTLCVYGNRPAKRHTLYRDVRRLGVREISHWCDNRVSFREVPFRPVRTAPYGERELREYSETLLDAVELRSSRHGNIVYLSSGWDSTALLACLVKLHGARKVRAVTGRMKYAERSGVINQFEIDRAQAIADYFGVKLDFVECDYCRRGPEDVNRLRPFLRSHQFSNMAVLNHMGVAEYVAQTSDGEAVFAGEISDGAHNLGFAQFTTIFHPVLEFREYSDKMASYLFGPTFLQLFQNDQFTDDPVYNLLRGRAGEAIFDEPAGGAPSNRTRQLLASFFLRPNRLPLWSLRNIKMLTEGGAAEYSKEMESTYLSHAAEAASQDMLYSWYLHLYNSFHWQSSTIRTLPLTAEANGFHLALPFWDSRLQEFLAAMPESWGRGLELKPTKYPLKWMLERYIDYPLHLQVGPHSYLYDVDPSFSHAAELMYGSALVPCLKNLLRPRPYRDILSPEMFDLAYIDGVVDHYLNGAEKRGAELNDLVAICWLSVVGWYGN
ncbi:hypothetical protein AMJ74_00800 [candidate division WOR_3 bacterium SM1_77]|uniref:asparagine synthase (glutamine-hydrolyzing) n=1 Tax=candidate division WOR_3 bacterium SM1_77 TaxID=1703778 RepID=A0A0S8K490_UNCW3|nr:MAG: hypothetical protein AMJ74_00800 [candidate division WOR_3 bacterium SM1_77]